MRTSRNKRAVGVEYVQNPRIHPETSGEVLVARARRLVLLSSGSFGSPTILERSGIGAKVVLEKYGVEQLVELPGVGENYQGKRLPAKRSSVPDDIHPLDHQVIFPPFLASEESETIDAIVRNEETEFNST